MEENFMVIGGISVFFSLNFNELAELREKKKVKKAWLYSSRKACTYMKR
jgi:hypothetical protein